MNVLGKILSFAAFAALAGCMSEEVSDTSQSSSPDDDNSRTEVLMTLKNRLSLQPVSKAGGIATEPENRIRSLDVYVFGSEAEDGTYTFQERFAYRENTGDLPVGATAIDLQAKGSEGKETTALLALKKGMFVKLYCIANQTALINPAKAENGGLVVADDFLPLKLSAPSQSGATLVAAGVPAETDFLRFHTPLFTDGTASDTIVTPLPMTGAYTTPLDLTDFTVSARTQIGFKLTRMVSRFDVINKAADSKLTIESISMAKGRRGSYFFPAKVYGSFPALDAELITCPARKFWGNDANNGTVAGAFYSWPSPAEDVAYLILKGKYQVNQTEAKEVTYQVPFKQEAADGSGSFLEIAANHRYTIAITKADEYHLDVNLTVSDWTDEGSLDEYNPEITDGKFTIQIQTASGEYDPDSHTVDMAIVNDATFDVGVEANSGIDYSLTYEKLTTTAPWLKVEEKPTTRASQKFNFQVSRNTDYHGDDFPVGYLRFTDKATGEESLLIIRPVATPVVKLASVSPKCSFDEKTGEMVLYKDATSGKTSVTLNIYSTGGCSFIDSNTSGTLPAWLERDKEELTGASGNVRFTLNVDDASFPETLPDGYSFDVVNTKNADKKQTVKVVVKTAMTVQQSAVTVSDGGNYDAVNNRMRLYNNASDIVTLDVFALNGSVVTGAPGWLTLDKTESANHSETYKFSVQNNASTGGSATITIKSKYDNSILKTFTVYSINKDLVFTQFSPSQSSYTTVDNLNATSPNVTFFPSLNAYFNLIVTSPKGIRSIVCHDNWRWMQQPSVSSSTDAATGLVTTTYRFTRNPAPVNGTRDVDEFFSTPTGDEVITLTNNYSGGTATKVFRIKHTTPVYRGSTAAPGIVYGLSKNYWVAPVNEKGSDTFARKGTCPTNWHLPSKDDSYQIVRSYQDATGSASYVDNQARSNAAVFGNLPFWTTEAYWYLSFYGNGNYRINTLGETDTNYTRCIQNK